MGLIPDEIPEKDQWIAQEAKKAFEQEVEIHTDSIALKLDELADLAEYWKKNRDKGIMPAGIRAGMIYLAKHITLEYLQIEPDTN